MKILIVEDEGPAARRLAAMLNVVHPTATILGPCDTVTSAVTLLSIEQPDLLLCDIELADGLSFRIWEEIEVQCPVIFITAYDQYAVRAFRVNSLDYLLKPIKEKDLAAALERFNEKQASLSMPEMMKAFLASVHTKSPQFRTRILATKGKEFVPISICDIAHFYSEDRLCFGVSKEGKTYLIGESISRLAEELNPNDWFQINRAQLVHIESVARVSPYLNHRLKLSLKPPAKDLSSIVARERATTFKAWMGG